MSTSNDVDLSIDPFSPLKQHQQQKPKTPKRSSNENCLNDSQFMDVDDDFNALNNFEESQEFIKFNSIFSNETGSLFFLKINSNCQIN